MMFHHISGFVGGKRFPCRHRGGLSNGRMWLSGSLAAALTLAGTSGAFAQGAERIGIELNKLEPTSGACQAYLVVDNGTDTSFESLNLDLVLFDQEGIVARRLAVELGPLSPEGTRVRVFGIEGMACEGITRVLLNGVLACRDGSGTRERCRDLLEVSSRASAPFID